MDSTSVIFSLIGLCIGTIGILIMAKPIKYILKIFLNCIFGFLGLYATNILFGSLGLTIGINILTLGFIGLLGIPGFFALFLIQLIV